MVCLYRRSIDLKKVNAETIVDAIDNVFTEFNISIENLVLIHMNSSSVMRGVRSGVLSIAAVQLLSQICGY